MTKMPDFDNAKRRTAANFKVVLSLYLSPK